MGLQHFRRFDICAGLKRITYRLIKVRILSFVPKGLSKDKLKRVPFPGSLLGFLFVKALRSHFMSAWTSTILIIWPFEQDQGKRAWCGLWHGRAPGFKKQWFLLVCLCALCSFRTGSHCGNLSCFYVSRLQLPACAMIFDCISSCLSYH